MIEARSTSHLTVQATKALARISHTVAGVTEANVVTGKEETAGRIGNTAKGFDAACRHKRPALRVARGGAPRSVEALNP